MKQRLILLTTALVLSVALCAVVPAVWAQTERPLREKDAKKLLKTSNKALQNLEKAAERGDAAAAEDHARGFTTAFERVERALAQNNVSENDALDVAGRVDEATLKHIPVLKGVLARVPDQAKRAIERALEVSRRGHDTATEAILNRGGVDFAGGVLNDRAACGAMERNEALLRHAQRSQRRGDQQAVERSVEQFAANIEQVGNAIENGAVDERDAVSVYDRVDSNTRRHAGILEGLLGQVPEQARPAIERAMLMSQRGNQAATQALSRTPAAARQAGRPGDVGAPGGVGVGAGGAGRGPGAGPTGGAPGGSPPRRPGGPPN